MSEVRLENSSVLRIVDKTRVGAGPEIQLSDALENSINALLRSGLARLEIVIAAATEEFFLPVDVSNSLQRGAEDNLAEE